MKKIPFLLSTLTITAGLVGGAAIIPLQRQAWALDDITQTNREDIYSDNAADLTKFIQFEWFDFAANQLRFETGGTANATGIRAQRVIIVYRDFESGVTEKEADQAALALGVEDSNALVTLVESKKPALGNTTTPKGKKITDNLTDIIYFAVQFGHETADETLEDSYWVRGKLDYRSCIHSTVFEMDKMICVRGANAATFVPAMQDESLVAVPDNDAVKTWEAEWKEEARRRLRVIDEQLQHLKTEVPELDSIVFLAGKQLDKLQQSIAKMKNMTEVDQEIVQLKKTLQEVQTMLGWMMGEYQQEIMDDLQNTLTVAQKDLDLARQQITILQKQLLQAEKEAEAANDSAETLQKELEQGRQELEQAQSDLGQMAERMQGLQAKLQETEAKLKLAVGESDATKLELEKLQQELSDLTAERAGLMQQIADLAAKNAELVQEVQNMNREGDTEDMGFAAVDAAIKLENEALKNQSTQLTKENETLKAQNTQLAEENAMLKLQIQRLQRELTEGHTTVIGEVKVGEKPLNLEGKLEDEGNNSTSVELMPEELLSEDVAVPNLGETEVKVNLWWVLAVVVGVLGAMGLWCKRRLNKR